MDPREISEAPWNRYQWTGNLVSLDGVHSTDFTIDEVLYVVAYAAPGSDWDTSTAAIIRLRDGRYAGWESTIGPTGSGFCQDAYGGDSDIWFAKSIGLIKMQISSNSAELLTWYGPGPDDPLVDLTMIWADELTDAYAQRDPRGK